jgi:3-oxoisoapionate decarboxylase
MQTILVATNDHARLPRLALSTFMPITRRQMLHTASAAAAALVTPEIARAAATPSGKVMVGMDHFAVRATGWKAAQLIDYAVSLKLDTLFLSELVPLESFEDAYLADLKAKADAGGLKLYVGTKSICSSSKMWKPDHGTPVEHMALTIRVAKALGSPVARCVLGGADDRKTDGGIEKHIEEVVATFKASKSRVQDAGLQISIENHAGDMQSHELKMLIEAAGKDYVGANIDPGNAVWALEDPLAHLEVLGPYTNCSSVRDSMVWETPEGAMVQWTAIGEGIVDFKAYAKRFAELAPGVPLNIETISGFAKAIPFTKDEFWKPYPNAKAQAFAGFVAMAKRGKAIDSFKAPEGVDKKEAEIAYQKGELERSVKWLRENAV